MRVLLSDGSGLTSRQVATRLGEAGHEVEALIPGGLAITRFTRHVRRVHRVPRYGDDPFGWLEAALEVARTRNIECLLPTQEQVAVLARAAERVRAAGIVTAIPPFTALRALQDKVSATTTLTEHGVPQPSTRSVRSPEELLTTTDFPVWVKPAIGTASTGVRLVRDAAQLDDVARVLHASGVLASCGAVVQEPVNGPLAMVQMVFCAGALVAFHANLRLREGHSGGAAVKESVDAEALRGPFAALGASLGWHGALSCDAILHADGPLVIDVNPRLVEPANAWRSGTDLVGAMLSAANGESPRVQPPSRIGVRTHQLLIGVLGAAQHERTRRAVWRELVDGLARRGPYEGSAEELTPVRGDWRAAIPLVTAAISLLAAPATERSFGGGAIAAYALTPRAWDEIAAGT